MCLQAAQRVLTSSTTRAGHQYIGRKREEGFFMIIFMIYRKALTNRIGSDSVRLNLSERHPSTIFSMKRDCIKPETTYQC